MDQACIRVHTLDDRQPSLSDKSHDTDRAQESRGIINQKKKCGEAEYSEASSDENDKLEYTPLHSVESAHCEKQGKNEETGRVPDDVVSNQYGCDNSGSQLSACHLKGNEERSKRKNYKA